MSEIELESLNLPEGFKQCVKFHGHICPGLVYGYRVATEAMELLGIVRAEDEELVAVAETDSCAVDALQVMLGTSAGKGNLLIRDYGKNAYTVFDRRTKNAYRFSKKNAYQYEGEAKEEFLRLERAVSGNTAGNAEKRRMKLLKSKDLMTKPFEAVFKTEAVSMTEPEYAPMAPSRSCGICGESTMSAKMVESPDDGLICIPCSVEKDESGMVA